MLKNERHINRHQNYTTLFVKQRNKIRFFQATHRHLATFSSTSAKERTQRARVIKMRCGEHAFLFKGRQLHHQGASIFTGKKCRYVTVACTLTTIDEHLSHVLANQRQDCGGNWGFLAKFKQ